MREKEEEKEGKAKEEEKGARERGGNPGKGKKEGGGKSLLRCSNKREARGPGAEPLAVRLPPRRLTPALSLGEKRRRGRSPGGPGRAKKVNFSCKSTRRGLAFLLLKFPRRAMLPPQIMAILSWWLFLLKGTSWWFSKLHQSSKFWAIKKKK